MKKSNIKKQPIKVRKFRVDYTNKTGKWFTDYYDEVNYGKLYLRCWNNDKDDCNVEINYNLEYVLRVIEKK